jgi:hypothetical protein
MLYQPGTMFQSWSLIVFIVLFIMYQYGWKGKSWERKRALGVKVVVITTIILLPLSFWGMYNLTGIENGGQYDDWMMSYELGPGDTYTSPALSNRYVVDPASLMIFVNNGSISVYLCDENNPGVRYFENNFSSGQEISYLGLPYIFSEFNTPAIWTFNIYNPTQSWVDGYFEIFEEQDFFPQSIFDDPLLPYQFPTIVLFAFWIVWGVFMLVSYKSMKKGLRPEDEHTENAEIQDEVDYESPEVQKYGRIRERER